MKYYIQHWYQFAVFIAGLIAVVIAFDYWNLLQLTILCSLLVIHLHFYEEMGFPGGFPWIGMNVELGLSEPDSTKWDLNQLSALWGNEWFALLVYVLPLFVMQWHWLSLAAVIFAFAEFGMHFIFFPFKLKKVYNPGWLTAVLGLFPLSLNYLCRAPLSRLYSWKDWLFALLWIVFNYWMAFRSPIYKYFGAMKQYSFTKEEVYRARRYMPQN